MTDWLPPASCDGVLLDLGVSSPQLDVAERGFSFLRDGPLDMRMDTTRGSTAAQWLARVTEAELCRVIAEYGEERFARRVARAIVAARATTPLDTTLALASVIAGAVPTREPGKHPATRSFQALRIRVNDELGEISRALEQAVDIGSACVCAGTSRLAQLPNAFSAPASISADVRSPTIARLALLGA